LPEKYLNDRQGFQTITFEVINLGIPGYTTQHGIQLLNREVANVNPDLLIVSFGCNDSKPVVLTVAERLALEIRPSGWLRQKIQA